MNSKLNVLAAVALTGCVSNTPKLVAPETDQKSVVSTVQLEVASLRSRMHSVLREERIQKFINPVDVKSPKEISELKSQLALYVEDYKKKFEEMIDTPGMVAFMEDAVCKGRGFLPPARNNAIKDNQMTPNLVFDLEEKVKENPWFQSVCPDDTSHIHFQAPDGCFQEQIPHFLTPAEVTAFYKGAVDLWHDYNSCISRAKEHTDHPVNVIE